MKNAVCVCFVMPQSHVVFVLFSDALVNWKCEEISRNGVSTSSHSDTQGSNLITFYCFFFTQQPCWLIIHYIVCVALYTHEHENNCVYPQADKAFWQTGGVAQSLFQTHTSVTVKEEQTVAIMLFVIMLVSLVFFISVCALLWLTVSSFITQTATLPFSCPAACPSHWTETEGGSAKLRGLDGWFYIYIYI